MINPIIITNYHRSKEELEEVILWWVCAAGKNGVRAAQSLESFLSEWRWTANSPFGIVKYCSTKLKSLPELMRSHGIGCYNLKAKTFVALANSGLDLRICSVEDLEKIPGIGPKTARCFIIHSRPNQQYAGLDTHCKQFLRDLGYSVPQVLTKKKYKELELVFLSLCRKVKLTVSELDLRIWNSYSGNKGKPEDILRFFNESCY